MSPWSYDLLGNKIWRIGDKYHREDGPAFEGTNGFKAWWIRGKRHRANGPAIIGSDGREEYWTDGIQIAVFSPDEAPSTRIQVTALFCAFMMLKMKESGQECSVEQVTRALEGLAQAKRLGEEKQNA